MFDYSSCGGCAVSPINWKVRYYLALVVIELAFLNVLFEFRTLPILVVLFTGLGLWLWREKQAAYGKIMVAGAALASLFWCAKWFVQGIFAPAITGISHYPITGVVGVPDPSNLYLAIWLHFGLFGLLGLLALAVTAAFREWKNWKVAHYALAALLLAGLVEGNFFNISTRRC